jgi:hypothetical protein
VKIVFATESYGTVASSVRDVFQQTTIHWRVQWITILSSLYNIKGVIYDMVDILVVKDELALELGNYYFLYYNHTWSFLIVVTYAYSYSVINIT